MRKTLSAVTAIAIMTAASLAFAANAKGTIKELDAAKRIITLDNGSQYAADKGVDWSKLKVGEKVSITFKMQGGKNDASAVKPM